VKERYVLRNEFIVNFIFIAFQFLQSHSAAPLNWVLVKIKDAQARSVEDGSETWDSKLTFLVAMLFVLEISGFSHN